MELELTRTQLACYDTVLDTTVTHEETMEMIVPDACPDILRIVETEGVVCLKSKEAKEGRVEVSGTARCAVLYLPDGEEGIRRIEVSIPFFSTADGAGISSACTVVACPRVLSADTRAINPRKVLVRVNLAISVKVFCPSSALLSTGAESNCPGGVEQLKENHRANMVTCVKEKPFSFTDDLSISGSRPEAAELLRCRAVLNCTESKIIGNKLIFKGEAALRICYRAVDCTLCTADFELPFSQIMETDRVEEEAVCVLDVQLTDLCCTLAAGDGRTISVTMGMLAQAVVREERNMELLTDIYSTACNLSAELQSHALNDMVEQNTRRQTSREIIEVGNMARNAVDASVNVGAVKQSREGGRMVFTAEAMVNILYLTEENELYSVSRQVNVPCPVDLPEGCACSCQSRCPGEVFATPTTGGLEVRFDLDFQYLALSGKRVVGVSDVQVGDAIVRDNGKEPSIVLRVVGQEKLWDIAKTYHTTMADIMQANELESGDALNGRLLLIPRKR